LGLKDLKEDFSKKFSKENIFIIGRKSNEKDRKNTNQI